MAFLYHICDWPYEGLRPSPPSLASDGYVHLSSASQLLRTAQRWYGDRQEVAVLVLRQEALGPSLRWEDTYGHGEPFPHLYAELPERALAGVVRLTRGSDGLYRWPLALGTPLLGEGPEPGEGFIEPSRRFPDAPLPELGLLHFFPRLTAELEPLAVEAHRGLGSPIGADPILVLERGGRRLAVASPGVGAPLAAVALEEMIALGCRRFVVCGGAGGLLPGQELGALVLVEAALRDEGVSHHYLPPSPRVETDSRALERAAGVMRRAGVEFRQGVTWTTDALYRETPERIERRRAAGALTVEMEAAALLAVARFRGVPLVPLLCCGDDLGSESWKFRDWTSAVEVHQRVFWLAVELMLEARPE